MNNISKLIVKLGDELTVDGDNLEKARDLLLASPEEEALLDDVRVMKTAYDAKNARLSTLKETEKELSLRAKPVESSPAYIQRAGDKDAGEIWLKNATASFLAHAEKKSVEQVIEERYPKDDALLAIRTMQKAAIPLATTFDAGWAAELTRDDIQGFLKVLAPNSVTAAIASRTLMLSFDGYDSVTIPRRNKRGAMNDLGGAFVGEGGAIPLGMLSIGAAKLSRYKQGVISDFSRELGARSTPSIQAIIREAILEDMAIKLDGVFLGSLAEVTGVQPAGILHGVTVGTADTAGGVASVVADLKALMAGLKGSGLGRRPVLLVNDEDVLSVGFMQSALGEFVFESDVASGTLRRIPFIESANVPKGTIIAVDAASLATAFDSPEFDVNDTATIVQADAGHAAPTMADDGSGAIGTVDQVPRNAGIDVAVDGTAAPAASVGYEARSLWQTYSVGVRSILPSTWGVVQPGGVVALNALKW